MKLGEHKRVKHGQIPGDVHRRVKIDMREKRVPIQASPWHLISQTCAKVYRRLLQDKSRTAQRQRDKKAIRDGLANEE